VLDRTCPARQPVRCLRRRFSQEGRRKLRQQRCLRFGPDQLVASSWIDKHDWFRFGEWVPLCAAGAGAGLSAVGGVKEG